MTEHNRPSERGFTLLEVLVAMSILAIIGAIAINILGTITSSRDSSDDAANRLTRLQMTTALLSRDIDQVVNRPVRNAFGETMPSMTFVPTATGAVLKLVRAGVETNITESRLQRVTWEIRDAELYRGSWQILDGAENTPDRVRSMQHRTANDAVEYWAFKFHYRNGADRPAYSSTWPPQGESPQSMRLPFAIEIHLNLAQTGVVELFYAIGE